MTLTRFHQHSSEGVRSGVIRLLQKFGELTGFSVQILRSDGGIDFNVQYH
jgi:hypothetical protein